MSIDLPNEVGLGAWLRFSSFPLILMGPTKLRVDTACTLSQLI